MHDPVENPSLDLTIIIPSKNEGPNLNLLLPALQETLTRLPIRAEILVVDAASDDGTPDIVASHGARYLREKGRGYGHAILTGAQAARGDYFITMDADLSHPTKFIEDLWAAREEGDLVIASRYVEGGGADQPFFRLLLSKILNAFFRYGLSLTALDLTSGYRLYHRRVFEGLEIRFTSFVFLVELLLTIMKRGGHVAEVPFHYEPREEGRSNARIIQFGIDYCRLFYQMWRIRNACTFPDYDWRACHSRIPLQRWWHRQRARHIQRFAGTHLPMVDVGCGSSTLLTKLPDGAIGLDLSGEKLRFMARTGHPLLRGNGCHLPVADESIATVVCSQLLEHTPEDGAPLLDELARVVCPGGVLVLGTPDYGRWQWKAIEWAYNKIVPYPYTREQVTHYDRAHLFDALSARGFTVRNHAYIGGAELIVRCEKEEAPEGQDNATHEK